MGRELRRVPLDFSWPLKKVWDGYLNPHYKKCPHCTGNGYTAAHERLDSLVRLLLLSGEDSLRGKDHPYFEWIGKYVGGFEKSPSPDMHELTSGLSGDGPNGRSYSNTYRANQAIIKAAGLDPETWGICTECKGEGIDPVAKEAYDKWTETEPPKGDGYQLWETTSEGSPSSPVFGLLDELTTWCADNATTFGSSKATKEQWDKMLGDGMVYHQEGNAIFM